MKTKLLLSALWVVILAGIACSAQDWSYSVPPGVPGSPLFQSLGFFQASNVTAAGGTATVTVAAPGVGKRLVTTNIAACASQTGATGGTATFSISDGVTTHFSTNIGAPGGVGSTTCITEPVSLVAAPNAALTIAFGAAASTTIIESVSINGYTTVSQ